MDYLTLRALHIVCAAISIGLFAARGAMQLAGVHWRRWPVLRFLPHVNDTVLLGAAVALAIMSAQYPFAQGWLTAKVVALLAYIVIGHVALKPGLPRPLQAGAFAAALACVGYILAAATTRSATLGLV